MAEGAFGDENVSDTLRGQSEYHTTESTSETSGKQTRYLVSKTSRGNRHSIVEANYQWKNNNNRCTQSRQLAQKRHGTGEQTMKCESVVGGGAAGVVAHARTQTHARCEFPQVQFNICAIVWPPLEPDNGMANTSICSSRCRVWLRQKMSCKVNLQTFLTRISSMQPHSSKHDILVHVVFVENEVSGKMQPFLAISFCHSPSTENDSLLPADIWTKYTLPCKRKERFGLHWLQSKVKNDLLLGLDHQQKKKKSAFKACFVLFLPQTCWWDHSIIKEFMEVQTQLISEAGSKVEFKYKVQRKHGLVWLSMLDLWSFWGVYTVIVLFLLSLNTFKGYHMRRTFTKKKKSSETNV